MADDVKDSDNIKDETKAKADRGEKGEKGEKGSKGEKLSLKGMFGNKFVVIGIIIAIQLLVVVLIGEKLVKPSLLAQEPKEVTIEVKNPQKRGYIHEVEDLIINLNDGEKTRYLRISVGFEVDNELAIAEMTERSAQVRDILITTISGRRLDELISVEGKELLKNELRERIAAILQSGKLMRIYFSNFVIQ
jgi:flagellar FliL protein